MSKLIDVGFAVLHEPLFFCGKNFEKRLEIKRYKGLTMQYDRTEKELHVQWNGKQAILPSTNVAYYVPGEYEDRKLEQSAGEMKLGTSATAQVETPMSHVHAGHGAGKTGAGGKVK